MEKEFIPYKQALTLKELGFDEPCFGFYIEDKTWVPASYSREGTVYPSNSDLIKGWVSAPTFSQSFKWFREKYRLFGDVGIYGFEIIDLDKKEAIFTSKVDFNKTYEESELKCLNKLIEIVKEKK